MRVRARKGKQGEAGWRMEGDQWLFWQILVLEAKSWKELVHVRTDTHTLQLQRNVLQGAHSAKMSVNPTDAFTR